MKSLVLLAVTLGVACGLPQGFQGFQGFQKTNQFQYKTPTYTAPKFVAAAPAPQVYKPVVARITSNGAEAAAQTLKAGNDINPDGSFNYYFETDNGIAAQAVGTPKQFPGNPPVAPDVIQGSFSWTSPDGQPIALTYVADENGYQPSGAALPTPPPIPEAILRSLEFIARNPSKENRQ